MCQAPSRPSSTLPRPRSGVLVTTLLHRELHRFRDIACTSGTESPYPKLLSHLQQLWHQDNTRSINMKLLAHSPPHKLIRRQLHQHCHARCHTCRVRYPKSRTDLSITSPTHNAYSNARLIVQVQLASQKWHHFPQLIESWSAASSRTRAVICNQTRTPKLRNRDVAPRMKRRQLGDMQCQALQASEIYNISRAEFVGSPLHRKPSASPADQIRNS